MARVVHFEIPVDDPERARAFYERAFGWTFEGWGDEGYWLAGTGDGDIGIGIDGALIRRGEIHAGPVVIVGVASIDDTLAAAEEAGAAVLSGKREIPTVGYAAYVRDPEGNVVGLFEPAQEPAAP